MTNLGVVSFLNSRPLIEGLDAGSDVSLHYAVPSALPSMLRGGDVDAALIPVIDLARGARSWQRVSDACIASDGETLTVRVFSRVPPEGVSVLYVDEDSHTSVALAQILWTYCFEHPVKLLPLSAAESLDDCESVLLIGDKVVTAPLLDHDYAVDLGGAWRKWTGLPFVFAVWAAPREAGAQTHQSLATMLEGARDRGVARAMEIAEEAGPARGWTVELAQEYLTRRLNYKMTPRHHQGLRRFIELAAEEGIVGSVAELVS